MRQAQHLRQTAVSLALASVAAVLGGLPLAAATVAVTVVAPVWRRIRRARRHRDRVLDELADTIDLLVVLVRAGITPLQATETLARRAPPAWRPAFIAVQQARAGGRRFVDALDELVTVVGPPGRVILDALAASERFGQPLMPALERLSAEGRAARRRHNDVKARELPVRLSFPLVCCTLPAFVLLTIAPLLAGALASLSHHGSPP